MAGRNGPAKPAGAIDPGPLLTPDGQATFDLRPELRWEDIARRIRDGIGIEVHPDDSIRTVSYAFYVMMEIFSEHMHRSAPQAVAGVLAEYREVARKVNREEAEKLRNDIISFGTEVAVRLERNLDKAEKPLQDLIGQMAKLVGQMQSSSRWTQFQWALVGACSLAGFLLFGVMGYTTATHLFR